VLDEAGHEILRLASRPAVREGHEAHLVTRETLAVPAAMLADEGALRITRENRSGDEAEAQRRDMRAKRIIGPDRGFDEVGSLRPAARVAIPPPIAGRRAVKGAFAHRGEVVGDEFGAELVALVDDRPELIR